jgi:hypothetical protein
VVNGASVDMDPQNESGTELRECDDLRRRPPNHAIGRQNAAVRPATSTRCAPLTARVPPARAPNASSTSAAGFGGLSRLVADDLAATEVYGADIGPRMADEAREKDVSVFYVRAPATSAFARAAPLSHAAGRG